MSCILQSSVPNYREPIYSILELIAAKGTGLRLITMSAIPALGEGCENTLNPLKLKFLIIILLQNRTQLSIQSSLKSPSNWSMSFALRDIISLCPLIVSMVSSSSKLEAAFLYSSDNGVMRYTSVPSYQHQNLNCRPGLFFKIDLHSHKTIHLFNEIIIDQDFGDWLHNQFIILKKKIPRLLFYSHSQYTQVLLDFFLYFLSSIIPTENQEIFSISWTFPNKYTLYYSISIYDILLYKTEDL